MGCVIVSHFLLCSKFILDLEKLEIPAIEILLKEAGELSDSLRPTTVYVSLVRGHTTCGTSSNRSGG